MIPKRPSYDWYTEQIDKRKEDVAASKRKIEEHAAQCEVVGKCNSCNYYHANNTHAIGDLKMLIRRANRDYPHGRNSA